MKFLKQFKDWTFEIGNRYFNQIDLLRNYTNANGYLSNLKILYKFYEGLWHEVKIIQKCGLWKLKEWIFIFNLLFCWLLYDFSKNMITFASTFNNSVKKYHIALCKNFSDLTDIHLYPYISIKNQSNWNINYRFRK